MEVSQLCLLVKHFPPDFTELEKRNLLKSYGAVDIRIMSQSGRLRNCAFATFPSLKSSRFALMSLHQLEMKGKRLVVEYAKQKEAGEHFARSAITETLDSVTALGDQFDRFCQDILSTTSFESCDYQANYIYPPPSPSIIANISRTLSMVPKFYIQVLHLMNRMCLPPPFGRNSFMFTSVTSMEEIPLPDQAAKVNYNLIIFGGDVIAFLSGVFTRHCGYAE